MHSSLFAIQIKELFRCYTSNGWIYRVGQKNCTRFIAI